MNADPTNDTHPAIEALLIQGYRRMSPSQKLERVWALTRGFVKSNRASYHSKMDITQARPKVSEPLRDSISTPIRGWRLRSRH